MAVLVVLYSYSESVAVHEPEPGLQLNRRQLFGLVGLGLVGGALSACGVSGDAGSDNEDAFTLDWVDMLPDHLKTGPESAEALATARRIQEQLGVVAGGLGRLALKFYDARRDAVGQAVVIGKDGPPNSWSGSVVRGQDVAHNTLLATFALTSKGVVRSRPQKVRLDFTAARSLSYISFSLAAKGDGKAMWQYDGIDAAGNRVTTADAITSLAQLASLEASIAVQLQQIPAADLA